MKENYIQTKTLLERFLNLLIDIENYQTPYAQTVGDPADIYLPLIRKKALLASGISMLSSLPKGVLGSVTAFSEIYFLLQLQSKMVKDIAAIYGKEKQLSKEILLYCLFKKSHPNLFESSLRFVGNRILLRPLTHSALVSVLDKIFNAKWKLQEKKWISRTLYFANALTCGTIAYIDTRIVGFTSVQVFSKEIFFE